jgi:hypothetical protein
VVAVVASSSKKGRPDADEAEDDDGAEVKEARKLRSSGAAAAPAELLE